ncbi:MAG: MFS transporter [candidate division Zixibacteria bacterium]|nr:MFS transporter [candidate division Zixibacteria bacterium]
MPSSIKAIMNIKRDELPLAMLMFAYFFLVITSFWILKPLKKTLFIGFYQQGGFDLFAWHMTASQAELLAKILNMIVAFLAVAIFTWLTRRFRRQQLTLIFSAFIMLCFVIYSRFVVNPGDITVWTFYLFGDLYSTLMVATFFAFVNDSVTPDKAKRLYGLIGLGGVLGGAFGSMVVRVWVGQISMTLWLWIAFAIAILIILIAIAAGKLVGKNPPPERPSTTNTNESKSKGNAAIEGAKLVFSSSYLLAIVAIVGLYEIVSTVMDFQFTATIEHYVRGEDIGKHFSTIYTISNFFAMFVQLFLTSFIMTRFGIKTALFILPVAIVVASGGFLVFPILWIGSFLNTADSGFSYSINQSAKETLYVPTSRDEKYKAKAFIDMFVQRFAKAIAVGVSLAITTIFADFSSIRWLSLFTVAIVVIWLFAVRYAGSKFEEIST